MGENCDRNCGSCVTLVRAPNSPIPHEATLYADLWVKPWVMPDAGMIVAQHAHVYAHTSIIASGAVRIWQDGVDLGVTRAPGVVKIPARVKHSFEVLEAGTTVFCVHNAMHGEAADIHEEHELALDAAE